MRTFFLALFDFSTSDRVPESRGKLHRCQARRHLDKGQNIDGRKDQIHGSQLYVNLGDESTRIVLFLAFHRRLLIFGLSRMLRFVHFDPSLFHALGIHLGEGQVEHALGLPLEKVTRMRDDVNGVRLGVHRRQFVRHVVGVTREDDAEIGLGFGPLGLSGGRRRRLLERLDADRLDPELGLEAE